jgi:hypothetical protein
MFIATGCTPVQEQDETAQTREATQQYFRKVNAHIEEGLKKADAAWTAAGVNKAIAESIEQARAVSIPTHADKEAVTLYRRFLHEAHGWLSVAPTWKTYLYYFSLGVGAGTIDFFGGSGLATTTLMSAYTMDANDIQKQHERMRNTLDDWRTFCAKNGYSPGPLAK